nr:MAG TPA: hypothetical protein [Caudoviricetes sp.]
MKINLLKETVRELAVNGVSSEDVLYVFNNLGYCSWEEFEKIANFDYNNGYGSIAVDLNLIVRGSDWWLERKEYDGSEWWEFRREPIKNEQMHNAELDVFYYIDKDY